MLESRWFYVAAAIAMLVVFALFQLELRTDPRPLGKPSEISTLRERDDLNLLFILIDTLRADRLGSYGYSRDTSPALDALAASGARFANQHSQSSWTKCSMASLWTGMYPIRTGVLRSPHGIASEATLPAEILREAGFRTYALWRNGWVGPKFGFSQGFEVYHSPRPGRIPATVRREKPTLGGGGTDLDLARSAVEFLRSHGQERWFLYLHLMDVHQYVYDEDTALFGTTYSDIYDNSIRWVDRIVGRVIEELDARGLRERTLVVVAADHGEAFGEHEREGHARDVYGEVTTTPLILSFPFRLAEGLVIEERSENVDLWPTLLDLLGLPPLQDPDGQSRVPQILAAGGADVEIPPQTPGFAHLDQNWSRVGLRARPMVAVNDGPYRLVMGDGSKTGALYDKSVDPGEQVDIGVEQPEVLARMEGLVKEYLERPAAPWGGAPEVSLDGAELEQLRALGYSVK